MFSICRIVLFALTPFVALGRSSPSSASDLAVLGAMGELTGTTSCQGCAGGLCFTSCGSRCGDSGSDHSACDKAKECICCVCHKLCMDDPLTCSTEPGSRDSDFCFPTTFTVTVSLAADLTHDDVQVALVRRDTTAGFERVDYIDVQGGTGDAVRGFTIRSNTTKTEWRVSLDDAGRVTGCLKFPSARSELPDCPALGAHQTGLGSQGGVDIDFWRSWVAPYERVDLVVARNGTGMGDVLRYTRIATSKSGRAAFVSTELYNYDTTPIAPITWALPPECPPQ